MDREPPKTRRESKKGSKEKKGDSIYSSKHIRQKEALQEKRK